MKVAIATDNSNVSAHFGRCNQYTIFEIEGKEIKDKLQVDCPAHQPGMLPGWLSERGVNRVIAGGMGPRAVGLFNDLDIQPIIGVTGKVETAINDFISGKLVSGESSCTHGTDGHHECQH
jgi:predicted Fe-Mo cluster-binding NifX family protein